MFDLVIVTKEQTKFVLENKEPLFNFIDKLICKRQTFSHDELVHFPFEHFSNLNEMCIEYGNIQTIPETIGKCKNLKIFEIASNELIKFPKEICDIQSLEEVTIFHNFLEEVDETITKLSNLKYLNLSHNVLRTFPKYICELQKLQYLNLSGNVIHSITEPLQNLVNLQELSLHTNKLRCFPTVILNLKNLEKLDLSSNKIKKIPYSIENLKNLKKLIISNNPLGSSITLNLKQLQFLNISNNINDILLPSENKDIEIYCGYEEYTKEIRYIREVEHRNIQKNLKREYIEILHMDFPEKFKCPICYSIFHEVRNNSVGKIYCKSCIEEHYRYFNTDPLTNIILSNKDLFPVEYVQNEIDEFIESIEITLPQ